MPDLSSDIIAAWLREREPLLADHPADETPLADDHEAVLPSVLRLGRLLDDCMAREPMALQARLLTDRARATTCAVLAQLCQGRRLRLLDWFGSARGLDDLPSNLLRDATNETGAFLRAEIIALHRRAVLGRIFGEDRIAALLAACTQAAGGRVGP